MTKKKVVKHLDDLPKTVDRDVEIRPFSDYVLSAEEQGSMWDALHSANVHTLTLMLEEADRLFQSIRTRLQATVEATDLLRRAENLMYNFEEHMDRHRYTLHYAYGDYAALDVDLHQLASINQLILDGQYPMVSPGQPAVLTPMQRHVLWHSDDYTRP